MIYLDNAATTKLKEKALEKMVPYLTEEYGNPSALYLHGGHARHALEDARDVIAGLIGAERDEIVFTSGGSESDSLAVIGYARANRHKGHHIVTSSIEHHAVLNACKALEKEGFEVTYVDPSADGIVSVNDIEKALRSDTILVSLMTANNEVGTLQPVNETGMLCRSRGIAFHTDAVQAFGHIPTDVRENFADLMSVSAHKFGGPKGTGFLFVRRGTVLQPLVYGGGQEWGLRNGTENVAGIIAMAAAAEDCIKNLKETQEKVLRLRERLIDGVMNAIEDAKLNGDRTRRLPGNADFMIRSVRAESLVIRLAARGICVSASSACASRDNRPSHVLSAMGLSDEEAVSSLRITIGEENTAEEIDATVEALKTTVEDLRSLRR